MFSNAEMQLAYKVANEPIRMFPYPHFIVRDVFPAEFYRALREHLPPTSAYRTLKSMGRVGSNYPDTRTVVPLTPDDVASLSEPYRSFWSDFAGWFLNGLFAQILLQKFSGLLAQRFEDPAAVEYTQEALVVQDRTNYSLGPHTDSPKKYFPCCSICPPTTPCRISARRCTCRATPPSPAPVGRITVSSGSSAC